MDTKTKTYKTAKTNTSYSTEVSFTASQMEAKRKFVYKNRFLINTHEIGRELKVSSTLVIYAISGVRRDYNNIILFCEDKIIKLIAELQKTINVPDNTEE